MRRRISLSGITGLLVVLSMVTPARALPQARAAAGSSPQTGAAAGSSPQTQAAVESSSPLDQGARRVTPGDPPVTLREDSLLTLTYEPADSRLIVALGPIDLPAHTTHHALQQMPVQFGTMPFDLTIHGYHMEVVDADGHPVPQIVLHHANILDPQRRELFLPIMRRVLAASHETPTIDVPGWLFGIPFNRGDRFMALTMLHNPTDRTYRGVHVRFVLEYERRRREDLLPLYTVYPFHLDVMFPLGSKAFDLPPGETVKSWEGSPAVPGGIIGMGGHLHKYATRLTFMDVTTGQVLYDITPELEKNGELAEVPALRYRGHGIGFPIYPDHVYRVTGTYFNPTGKTIPDGAMASVGGGFVPDAQVQWPVADSTNPMYATDYRNVITSTTMEGMEAGEGHMHPMNNMGSMQSGSASDSTTNSGD